MNLPKKDKDGCCYISYSQISLWNDKKGFDTGELGKIEYIRKYFFNEEFENKTGYGEFGSEAENYICLREDGDKFDDREKQLLETINPLGVFQKEFKLQFDGFYVLGYIDDATKDLSHLRDYKTCSRKSGEKYKGLEYEQLAIYAAAIEQETGKLPEKLEVCCIGRTGNGFRGGRNVLKVGDEVWYEDRSVDLDVERIALIKEKIIRTAKEIEEYWNIFLELNS